VQGVQRHQTMAPPNDTRVFMELRDVDSWRASGWHELDADHHFPVLTDLLEATIVVSFPSGAASHVLTGMRPRLNQK
jgi:hypothetical protein